MRARSFSMSHFSLPQVKTMLCFIKFIEKIISVYNRKNIHYENLFHDVTSRPLPDWR